VVTDVGGTAAVLGESLRHRLVPAGDPAALAAGWREALTQTTRRAVDGTAGRERIERLFGLEPVVREYERIYTGES
jgi:hypothetical protein